MPTIVSISDEEYRLLRQNLFERFASGAVAPSEAPVVPVVHPSRHSSDGGRKFVPFVLDAILISAKHPIPPPHMDDRHPNFMLTLQGHLSAQNSP